MVLEEDKFEKLEGIVQSKYPIAPVTDIEPHAKEDNYVDVGGFDLFEMFR